MPKKAVSLTLEEGNLLWLRGVTGRSGARSLSDTVDRIVADARQSVSGRASNVRSIVGAIEIPEDDPNLEAADASIRDLFARSLARSWPGASHRRRRTERRRA
jgi:hypothetical protein